MLARLALLLPSLAFGLLLPSSVLACSSDGLGISRVLPVGTQGGGQVGFKSYSRSLPLEPGEVVLTFDDGPFPGRTDRVLDILKAECVKATFFMVGRAARSAPSLARRAAAEGHTIAYHSMTHANLRGLTLEAAKKDIEDGIAAVDDAAFGQHGVEPHTPFFRFPGFADSSPLNAWLATRNIVTFGTDVWASDWSKETPRAELNLVLSRLERTKGGIVLFHDIQPRTIAMLPDFLSRLKARGFRIVHIVPGQGPLRTREAPAGWASMTERILASLPNRRTQKRISSNNSAKRPRRS